jgi:formate hydrogenlyase subunit 4
MMDYLLWILQVVLVPLLAPLGVGIINKVKARLQKRTGASVFQPYRNLRKLFHKDEVIAKDASWVFRVAPFIVFGVTVIAGASIPLFSTAFALPTSDLLMLVYILAIGVFFLALAGMDTGSAFGGFGASREVSLGAVAEGVVIFSLVPLVLFAGSTNLFTVATSVSDHYVHILLPILISFFAFGVAVMAEAKRYPFDNPDTHLELTMVHEAMLLEYSGKRLALMEWAAANKLFLLAALGANLFFPMTLATGTGLSAAAIGLGALLVKMLALYLGVVVVESVMAKLRYFRLFYLLFGVFIINLVAIGLVL